MCNSGKNAKYHTRNGWFCSSECDYQVVKIMLQYLAQDSYKKTKIK